MKNKNWIGIGAVLVIVILGSLGYVITDKTYYCEEKGIVIECARFSGSGLRCYPDLTTTKGYRDCTDWTKLKDYIGENQIIENKNIGEKYLCSVDGCLKN